MYYSYKEAVKDLFKKDYKEVYVVRVFMENEVVGTEQFFIYSTEEEAQNYINRVLDYYKTNPFHEVISEEANSSFWHKYVGMHDPMHTWFEVLHERAA